MSLNKETKPKCLLYNITYSYSCKKRIINKQKVQNKNTMGTLKNRVMIKTKLLPMSQILALKYPICR